MTTDRTRLCLALVVLAAVGSAVAVPLTTINAGDAPANESGNTKSEALAKFQKEETDPTTTGTELSPQQQPNTLGNESTGSEFPAVVTDSEPQTPKTDQSDVTANVEASTESNLPGTTAEPNRLSSPQGQNSKPHFTGNVQTVNMGSGLPFFMELLQPIHPFPGQYNQQPSRYQQPPPFAAPVNPFYPFTSPVGMPSFNQMFTDYTNEFRKMLESLDKSMAQMDNVEVINDSQVKPVGKTTTRTEIIDGHVVQINETTYTDGDSNHKSFYHYKEIQVLPEKPNKKISSSEQVISSVDNNSQTKNEDTDDASNEIKRESPEIVTPIAETTSNNNNNKLNKKASGPVPLDDLYQTAAATYYAPHVPYGSRPALYYPRPALYYGVPPPAALPPNAGRPYPPRPEDYGRPQAPAPAPVSLHSDINVNNVAAMIQQSSGNAAVLPPDVEFVDVSGKPQQGGAGQFLYNSFQQNGNGRKFPGRKY